MRVIVMRVCIVADILLLIALIAYMVSWKDKS